MRAMQHRRGPAEAGNDGLSAMGPEERPRAVSARLRSPLSLFLVVLALVFVTETLIMVMFHTLQPDLGWFAESLADGSILIPVIAAPLWWLIAQRGRAEQALQTSEEQFRSLIENASDVITVLGKDGAISFVSPSARRVLGYEPEELIGKNVFNFVHPDDLTGTLARFSDLMQHPGGHQSAEFRFRHADGSWRFLEAIGKNPTRDPAAATLIINSRDITERKQAEEESNLLQSVALAVSEAHDLRSGLDLVLQRVCGVTGWSCGEAWTPSRDGAALECAAAWCISNEALDNFRSHTEAFTFAPGVGLPGRVWSSKQPAWVRDVTQDTNFPRAPYAKEAGLRAGVGIPVLAGDDVVAVIGFFMLEAREEDERLVRLISAVAVEMGALLQRKQTEDALRESEGKFRQLVNQATDAILLTDLEGRFIDVNQSACDSLGYTREELLTLSVADIAEDFTPDRFREDRKRLDRGVPLAIESNHRRRDGTTFPVEVRVGLVEFDGHRLMLGLAHDITERKQAEEALRESEERFRTFMDNSPAVAFMKDEEGRFVYLNRPFRNVFGVKEKDWLGKTDFDVFSLETASQNRENDLSVLSSDRPLETVEVVPVPDGDPHHWIVFKFPVRSASGERFLGGMAVDITERKQAEDALRQSEEQTRRIVETAYAAFISIDAEGVITAWNAAAETIFGWPREEAVGRPLSDTIVPPQYRDAHTNGLQHFLATGEGPVLNKRIEITALHRDGHEFPVELAVWAVRSGETWTFHAFVHDVTLRKQAEEALRRLNSDLEAERNTVRNLNRLLEARVRDRTQNLRQANLELRERHHQLLDARAQAATDGLTGLGNHRSFQEHVRSGMSAAGSARSFSLVMLDIDGFKKTNDSLGHQAGDGVLRACAHAFAAVVGEQSVYRYGGDEFAVLVPDCDMAGAEEVAERLRRAALDISAPVTISLGVASYPETAGTSDELIYQADAAMYAAKMAGKNRTCRWDRMPSAPSRTPRQRSTPVA